MRSPLDALQTTTSVELRRGSGELHSVAKRASFCVAFRADSRGFGGQHGRQNWWSGLVFAMLFLNSFLYRFRLDFLRLRTSKIELSPRREHSFCKTDVFQKRPKNDWFELKFWRLNQKKSMQHHIPKYVVLRHWFLCDFLRCWLRFEVQKSKKNPEKTTKLRFGDALRTIIGCKLLFGWILKL